MTTAAARAGLKGKCWQTVHADGAPLQCQNVAPSPVRAKFHSRLLFAAFAACQAWAPLASASGAFFSERDAPIRQVGEQVLLLDNADGTTTAIIQMEYEGAATDFAWLLPMAGMPLDLTVTERVPFERLARVTAPRFQLEIRGADACQSADGITVVDPLTGVPPRPVYQGSNEVLVSVAGSGRVDDFEWTVLSVDPSTEDPARAAIEWLVAAGFEVPEPTAALLEPYLASGMHPLALRLQKSAEPGAIAWCAASTAAKRAKLFCGSPIANQRRPGERASGSRALIERPRVARLGTQGTTTVSARSS